MKIKLSEIITKEHIIVTGYLYIMTLFSMGAWFLINLTGLQEEIPYDIMVRISIAFGIILPVAIYVMRFNKNDMEIFFLRSGKIVLSEITIKEFIRHTSILSIFMLIYISSNHILIEFIQNLFGLEMFPEGKSNLFVLMTIMLAPVIYFSLYAVRIKKMK